MQDDFQALLAHLHRPGGYGHFWRKAGKLTTWWNGEGLPALPTTRDLYFGVHPCTAIPPTNADGKPQPPERVRAQLPYIAAVNCLFGEYDAKDFGNSKETARAHIDLLEPPPSVIIDSGGGWHCYWLLTDPWLLTTPLERERAKVLQAQWVRYVGSDDGAKDLTRVLRVPGTVNGKYQPVRRVVARRFKLDQTYDLDELLKFLPETTPTGGSSPQTDADRRRRAYAEQAMSREQGRVIASKEGQRNKALNSAAFNLGQLVSEGLIERPQVEAVLISAGVAVGLSQAEAARTTNSGLSAGANASRTKRLPDFTAAPESGPGGGSTTAVLPFPALAPLTPWAEPDHRSRQPTADQVKVLNTLNLTDLGNAEALALLYGLNLRYCNTRERWLTWDDSRWRLDEASSAFRAVMSSAHARRLAAERIEGYDTRKKVVTWAIGSENRGKIESTLAVAGHLTVFATTIDRYDADPMVAATGGATLDLRTGTDRSPVRDDYITMSLGTAFSASATCPRWEQFLVEIFAGDTELIRYIQRAVGYCLTGDTREQKVFLCYGNGSNGKSRFLEVLTQLLGDYSANASFDTFDADRRSDNSNDLAALKGRRLVTVIETEADRRLAEARVKSVTGGDLVTARFLYGEFFSYRPQFKIWLAMNHKPTIKGTDRGIWRRLKLIPFTQSFEGREDMNLDRTLQQELPGILNWALTGLREWLANGLGHADAIDSATQKYQEESDQVGRWLDDCTVAGPSCTVPAAAAYKSYTTWCEANGERAFTQTLWGRRLSDLGFTRERGRKAWQWQGFGLTDERDDPHTSESVIRVIRCDPFSGEFSQNEDSNNSQICDPCDPCDPDSDISPMQDSFLGDSLKNGSQRITRITNQVKDELSAPAGPLSDLPGVQLVRCDHKGNAARYGIYWKAVGPDGETDPDQYEDTVIASARRRWGAAGAK
jgi:putative DNA primase/helicase